MSRVLALIRERQYQPGDKLPSERELSRKFSVSRAAIREELSVIESMRVIERVPQSGIFVRDYARTGSLDTLVLEADMGLPMTVQDVRDLNEFRSVLEIQAVMLACARRTPGDLERLDRILDAAQRAMAAGDSVSRFDAEFHLSICMATQNNLLARAATSFWLASEKRRDKYFADVANAERSLRDHRAIVEAIRSQDTARADALMKRHLGQVERYWMEDLKREA